MRINRGLLGWGVFFLLVGAVPLAVRAGLVSDDQIGRIGSLWPLILIGIGVGMLLARTRFALVGGLVVAATFGLMVGGALSGGIDGFAGGACGPGAGTTAFPARDGRFETTTASVELEFSCGTMAVSSATGDTWRVEGEDANGSGPSVDADGDSLSVGTENRDRGPFGFLSDRESWRVTLPSMVGLELRLELNAGSSTVDLSGASIETIDLNLNAGSAILDLGSVDEVGPLDVEINAGSVDLTLPNQSLIGSIEVNAGSVNLCVPAGTAMRFNTEGSNLSSFDFADQGLIQDGSTWQTPSFESAVERIELDARTNAGSLSLNPEDGCRG
jgi:hypothetical protein